MSRQFGWQEIVVDACARNRGVRRRRVFAARSRRVDRESCASFRHQGHSPSAAHDSRSAPERSRRARRRSRRVPAPQRTSTPTTAMRGGCPAQTKRVVDLIATPTVAPARCSAGAARRHAARRAALLLARPRQDRGGRLPHRVARHGTARRVPRADRHRHAHRRRVRAGLRDAVRLGVRAAGAHLSRSWDCLRPHRARHGHRARRATMACRERGHAP